MEITEKELYCIARIFQSMIFFSSLFRCCEYCGFRSECSKNVNDMTFDEVRKKLDLITGVHLGMLLPNEELLKKEKPPSATFNSTNRFTEDDINNVVSCIAEKLKEKLV